MELWESPAKNYSAFRLYFFRLTDMNRRLIWIQYTHINYFNPKAIYFISFNCRDLLKICNSEMKKNNINIKFPWGICSLLWLVVDISCSRETYFCFYLPQLYAEARFAALLVILSPSRKFNVFFPVFFWGDWILLSKKLANI